MNSWQVIRGLLWVEDHMTKMLDLINELWFLKRNIISDDFDQALYRLAEEVPMTIHEVPTGTPCWTWRVPEK